MSLIPFISECNTHQNFTIQFLPQLLLVLLLWSSIYLKLYFIQIFLSRNIKNCQINFERIRKKYVYNQSKFFKMSTIYYFYLPLKMSF